ncbi:MAG: tRNA dihydrouridine synthase [Candidatus Levyibacteriota bacterium]
MKFSWHDLPKPFTALAPLDGVTDVVFRQIITEIGKPDVLFTEFTPVDGFVSSGKERVEQNFKFTSEQQPVIAQIWGIKPENFYTTAKAVKEMGFAGVDINMGCPVQVIIKGGACSALIKNPSLAAEIIQATKEGADGLPVSIKTRIGFGNEQIDEWIGFLLAQNLSALTVHLRTVKELSKVSAHWEYMPRITALRDEIAPETILSGNGDIITHEEINEKYELYHCDGFMVGRGIFANPWMFSREESMKERSVAERVGLYKKHIQLYSQTWGEDKHFANLKKFGKTYISNFPDASNLREKLMEAKNIQDLLDTLNTYKI